MSGGGRAGARMMPRPGPCHDEDMDPAAGRLLVAAPTMSDPNFARTIVLLVEVGTDGALGVVLNRTTEVAVAEVLDDWAALISPPAVLFRGGPVEVDSALGLARVREGEEPLGWRRACGDLGLVDLDAPVEVLAEAVSGMRIFAGYAGWGAGQLEDEIAEGAWFVVEGEDEDALNADAEGLWRRVLRRQGGRLAMLATLPEDPRQN